MYRNPTEQQKLQLTEQQTAIMQLVAQGYNFREIGERLYISPTTVNAHLYYARHAMRARNTTHLLMLCLREGIISIDDLFVTKEK